MKTLTMIALVSALVMPLGNAALAAKAAKAVKYQCIKCHMQFSAIQAKADHYKCPMDGGKLVPMTPVKPAHKTK